MDLGLGNSVAFITGASKGIGRECARVLAEEGCTVVVTARGKEQLEETARLWMLTGCAPAPLPPSAIRELKDVFGAAW